jgi:hypothetical protein
MYPVQDWDLAVADIRHGRLLLDLASDRQCPQRDFFLSCLYLLVGDAVRSQGRSTDFASLEGLLREAEARNEPCLGLWAKHARHVLANPGEFDYRQWCDGGLARQSIEADHGSTT